MHMVQAWPYHSTSTISFHRLKTQPVNHVFQPMPQQHNIFPSIGITARENSLFPPSFSLSIQFAASVFRNKYGINFCIFELLLWPTKCFYSASNVPKMHICSCLARKLGERGSSSCSSWPYSEFMKFATVWYYQLDKNKTS